MEKGEKKWLKNWLWVWIVLVLFIVGVFGIDLII